MNNIDLHNHNDNLTVISGVESVMSAGGGWSQGPGAAVSPVEW